VWSGGTAPHNTTKINSFAGILTIIFLGTETKGQSTEQTAEGS